VDLREAGKNRRRRQILDAARQLIEADGRDALSMRRLAEVAQLSTRTLYNLYGAKEDILYALTEESIREVESILAKLAIGDPLDRSRALLTVSIELRCARAGLHKALIRGIELGGGRSREAELVGIAREQHEAVIAQAMDQGLLLRTVSPQLLAHQIVMNYGQTLRLWSRDVFDASQLKAQALHARALYLLAIAAPQARGRLERELESLEPELQTLVRGIDGLSGPLPLVVAARERKHGTV